MQKQVKTHMLLRPRVTFLCRYFFSLFREKKKNCSKYYVQILKDVTYYIGIY